MADDAPRYGEQPLAQTVAAAGALRRLDRAAAVAGTRASDRGRHAGAVRRVGAASWPPRSRRTRPPRIGRGRRRRPARVPRPRVRHRRLQPVLPRVHVRPPRWRKTPRAVSLSRGLRGPPGTGATAAFSPCSSTASPSSRAARRPDGQDALADGDVPPAHADPHRAAFRYRAVEEDHRVTSTARLLLDDEVLCVG